VSRLVIFTTEVRRMASGDNNPNRTPKTGDSRTIDILFLRVVFDLIFLYLTKTERIYWQYVPLFSAHRPFF